MADDDKVPGILPLEEMVFHLARDRIEGERFSKHFTVSLNEDDEPLMQSGRFGTAYMMESCDAEGEPLNNGERMVVKVLRRDVAGAKSNREKFEQELIKARMLRHPHVVEVIETGFYPAPGNAGFDAHYIAMEAMDATLAEVMGDSLFTESLDPDRIAGLIGDIVSALEYARFKAGVESHRDLHAGNILFRVRKGMYTVKVGDMGSAFVRERRNSTRPVQSNSLTAQVRTKEDGPVDPETVSMYNNPDHAVPSDAQNPLFKQDGQIDMFSLAYWGSEMTGKYHERFVKDPSKVDKRIFKLGNVFTRAKVGRAERENNYPGGLWEFMEKVAESVGMTYVHQDPEYYWRQGRHYKGIEKLREVALEKEDFRWGIGNMLSSELESVDRNMLKTRYKEDSVEYRKAKGVVGTGLDTVMDVLHTRLIDVESSIRSRMNARRGVNWGQILDRNRGNTREVRKEVMDDLRLIRNTDDELDILIRLSEEYGLTNRKHTLEAYRGRIEEMQKEIGVEDKHFNIRLSHWYTNPVLAGLGSALMTLAGAVAVVFALNTDCNCGETYEDVPPPPPLEDDIPPPPEPIPRADLVAPGDPDSGAYTFEVGGDGGPRLVHVRDGITEELCAEFRERGYDVSQVCDGIESDEPEELVSCNLSYHREKNGSVSLSLRPCRDKLTKQSVKGAARYGFSWEPDYVLVDGEGKIVRAAYKFHYSDDVHSPYAANIGLKMVNISEVDDDMRVEGGRENMWTHTRYLRVSTKEHERTSAKARRGEPYVPQVSLSDIYSGKLSSPPRGTLDDAMIPGERLGSKRARPDYTPPAEVIGDDGERLQIIYSSPSDAYGAAKALDEGARERQSKETKVRLLP